MSCCSYFVLWALRSLCYCICQIKPSKPCKWKSNLLYFIVTGCTHIYSFIDSSEPDLLLLGPYGLSRISGRENISRWEAPSFISTNSVCLQVKLHLKSQEWFLSFYVARLRGSVESMGFALKNEDLRGCIVFKAQQILICWKTMEVLLIVSEWPKYPKNNDLMNRWLTRSAAHRSQSWALNKPLSHSI